MFSRFEIQLLPVRDYNSKTKAQQQELLPLGPGIYVWTIDLGHLADPAVAVDDPLPLFDRVQGRIRPVAHEVGARIGSYHRTTLRVDPVDLTDATKNRLESIEAAGTELLEWSLLCGTLLQRPLYIGKAVSLRNRIRAHLKAGSRLRGYLDDVGLDVSDCAVLLLAVRSPDQPYGVVDGVEALIAENEDLLSDADDEEELSDDAPTDLVDIDALVRVAESLTIRLSHPLLNRKQD